MSISAKRAWLLLFAVLIAAACSSGGSGSGDNSNSRPTTYSYTAPPDIGDGWSVASLASEGFDTPRIESMMLNILNGTFPGIDSVAIARNGRLVHYWYDTDRRLDQFDAWINNTQNERHVLHSTSKSVTSALIGIAIDQGFINSVDVPFYDLFSYVSYDNWDARKADMSLEDVLTMRLGMTWDEWSLPYTDPDNDLVNLENNNLDWAKALLDLPMSSDPGTIFTYNTAATIALGQALQNATGMDMHDFANQYLFFPLQINDAEWWRSPSGLPVGGSGLFLRTRDLLKFGQVFVDDGAWQGQQIISSDWIAASTSPHVDISSWATYSEAYGYQWWLDEFNYNNTLVDVWVTSGYGGQYLFCVPALNLVVAFTGRNYTNGVGVADLYTMVQWSIISAID